MTNQYTAAKLTVDIKVETFRTRTSGLVSDSYVARDVTVSFYEKFNNNTELEQALKALVETIRGAVRR